MVDTEAVVGIKTGSELLEQLGKAFIELESSRDVSSCYGILWEEIKEHFLNLENSVKERVEEIEEKEKTFAEKISASQVLLAKREAAVTAKEQALLDRIQHMKDAAVAAVAEAHEKYKVASPEAEDNIGNEGNKVSTSVNSDPNASFPATEGTSPDSRSGEFAEAITAEIKPRPQLEKFCELMDAKGLLKFLHENRKNLATIRKEIPIALKSATEPARLVLDSLEGVYPSDNVSPQENEKDMALQALRKTCLVLMESAAPLLGMIEPGGNHPLSSASKRQAKAIADNWKLKLAGMDMDAAHGNALETHAFFQLLATFSIASEFDEDELCKLVLAVSRRRQAPELCRSLGLTHKMPGVIETLINSGKQIDAVHFTHAFQLSERFPPVPLLKAYLVDLRKNAQEKSDNSGAGGVQDVYTQELGALRAVIRCIEEYNLQTEYPPGPLQKRVAQLEKAKADKKRMGEAAKFHPKKFRGSGGYGRGYAPRFPTVADNRVSQPVVFDDSRLHFGGSERYPYSVPASYNYQMPMHGSYGQQANAQDQRSHYCPDERVSTTSYNTSLNYGNYMGTGL